MTWIRSLLAITALAVPVAAQADVAAAMVASLANDVQSRPINFPTECVWTGQWDEVDACDPEQKGRRTSSVSRTTAQFDGTIRAISISFNAGLQAVFNMTLTGFPDVTLTGQEYHDSLAQDGINITEGVCSNALHYELPEVPEGKTNDISLDWVRSLAEGDDSWIKLEQLVMYRNASLLPTLAGATTPTVGNTSPSASSPVATSGASAATRHGIALLAAAGVGAVVLVTL